MILFSTIPTLWPRDQGHGLRNFMLKFFSTKFLRSCIYSASFQIILLILFIFDIQIAMEDVLHPKLYPVPCLPFLTPSPSTLTPTTPSPIYDLDFKALFCYLTDKCEFRQAILGDRSCFILHLWKYHSKIKGDNCDFPFALLYTKLLLKWGLLYKERSCSVWE